MWERGRGGASIQAGRTQNIALRSQRRRPHSVGGARARPPRPRLRPRPAAARRAWVRSHLGGPRRRELCGGSRGDRATMSGVDVADKSDLLAGNARYKKLADLNEGTFGVVMLGLDRRSNEQARRAGACSMQ